MKKVILFLCQGLEEYEASAFTDAIGWTTTYGMEPVELVTVGLRKVGTSQKVKTSAVITSMLSPPGMLK
ncbi:hypothetical protein [Klebsiella quasipneumoniae]|uniref:hypothetical protein n=1 Tax=Klebsiella quasipneumoniae TaxID=1463165 RepID=UPI001F5E79E2|nr:hypothetical protein [Klebsiella quasipneumoniae]